MARIPLDSLLSLQKAIPGTTLGPNDARPFIGAQIIPTLDLPKVIVPTLVPPLTVTQGSVYFTYFETFTNRAGLQRIMTILAGGLWHLTGSFISYSGTAFSDGNYDRLYIDQEGTNSFFLIKQRTPDRSNPLYFDFSVLLRDDGEMGVDFGAANATETAWTYLSMQCQKIL